MCFKRWASTGQGSASYRADEERLITDMIELTRQFGRYGYPLAGSRTMRVKRKLNATEVIDALTELFVLRGVPACIRSDNGPLAMVQEPMVHKLASSLRLSGIGSEPSAQGLPRLKDALLGSAWKNRCCERFNGRMRPSR